MLAADFSCTAAQTAEAEVSDATITAKQRKTLLRVDGAVIAIAEALR